MNRRNWLKTTAGLLVAAPFVVRAESIMRVRPVVGPQALRWVGDSIFSEEIVYNELNGELYKIRITNQPYLPWGLGS